MEDAVFKGEIHPLNPRELVPRNTTKTVPTTSGTIDSDDDMNPYEIDQVRVTFFCTFFVKTSFMSVKQCRFDFYLIFLSLSQSVQKPSGL